MAFLVPDKIRTEKVGTDTITIKEKIIPDSLVATKRVASYVNVGDKMKPCKLLNGGTGIPKGVTIHNTNDINVAKGTNPAEQYTRATYNGNMNGAVVHFYVYKTEIWQMLNENEQGWHAADGSSRRTDHRGLKTGGNLDTIAIECIGDIEESKTTTAKLTAYLCNKYNLIPKLDVYTHNWWMHGTDKMVAGARKNCPIYILNEWDKYLERINDYYNFIKDVKSQSTSTPAQTTNSVCCEYYYNLEDVPKGEFRDIITKLMKTPVKHGEGFIINGYDDGSVRLSHDMVRMLVFNYRAGLYD